MQNHSPYFKLFPASIPYYHKWELFPFVLLEPVLVILVLFGRGRFMGSWAASRKDLLMVYMQIT